MRIDFLRVHHLRCFEHVEFEPGPGINWLTGPNGSGKTTLLEAAHLLSRGRSFRGGGRTALCRHGKAEYAVHAVVSSHHRTRKVGLARQRDAWVARQDGLELPSLAPLFESCPVVSFEPGSQALVSGPAEERRRFLDWCVFHVEQASLALWRIYRRLLRQRNVLLHDGATDAQFEPWEHDLDRVAVQIDCLRRDCLAAMKPYLLQEMSRLVPELGEGRVRYRSGWDDSSRLLEQLAQRRDRDRERGYTTLGPHRGDWGLEFEQIANREHLSRGQAKAIALACVLAQAEWFVAAKGEYPLVCLDDLHSELDPPHVAKVVERLNSQPMQAWVTSTVEPGAMGQAVPESVRVFHVEHTQVRREWPP